MIIAESYECEFNKFHSINYWVKSWSSYNQVETQLQDNLMSFLKDSIVATTGYVPDLTLDNIINSNLCVRWI